MGNPTCERCQTSLKGKEPFDLWVLVTTHDDEGECEQTGSESGIVNDYIVIGAECCGQHVWDAWDSMAKTLNINVPK